MQFAKHLYISEQLKDSEERIKEYLISGKLQINLYVLAIPKAGAGQLEIYNSNQFLQPLFPADGLYVVGFARGYGGAMELLDQIVTEVYEKTQTADIKSFLLSENANE